MEKSISAAEANRSFSKLLRDVREGQTFIVTAHGRPVAKITPVSAAAVALERGRARLLERLRQQEATDVGRWTRDELYDGQ